MDNSDEMLRTPPSSTLYQHNVSDYFGLEQDFIASPLNTDTNRNDSFMQQDGNALPQPDTLSLMTAIKNLEQSQQQIIAEISKNNKRQEKMMEILQKLEESNNSNNTILQSSLQSIATRMENLEKQAQINPSVMEMLQKLLPLINTSNNPIVQQPSESASTINDIPSQINVNETLPTIATMNRMTVEQRLLERITNAHAIGNSQHQENQILSTYTATNHLQFNNQLSMHADEMDVDRIEGNFETTTTAPMCFEIHPDVVQEPLSSTTNTDCEYPQKNQLQSESNQPKSSSMVGNHPSSRPICGTNSHSSISDIIQDPVVVRLRHSIRNKYIGMEKNARPNCIVDLFEKPLELILCRGRLSPGPVKINLNMVSSSRNGNYFSPYKLSSKQKEGYHDTLSIECQVIDGSPQRIILTEFYAMKCLNSDVRENKNETTNNKKKQCTIEGTKQTYSLTPYPSGEIKTITGNTIKEILDAYNLRVTRLAISFPGGEAETLYSNKLSLDLGEKSDGKHDLGVDIIIERWTDHFQKDRYQMKCTIKIPEIFHCTLGTGYQWLEISLSGELCIFYNEAMCESLYVSCKEESVEECFDIVHRDEHVVNPIHCAAKVQFLYCEGDNESSKRYYTEYCKPWKSREMVIDVNDNSTGERTSIFQMESAIPETQNESEIGQKKTQEKTSSEEKIQRQSNRTQEKKLAQNKSPKTIKQNSRKKLAHNKRSKDNQTKLTIHKHYTI